MNTVGLNYFPGQRAVSAAKQKHAGRWKQKRRRSSSSRVCRLWQTWRGRYSERAEWTQKEVCGSVTCWLLMVNRVAPPIMGGCDAAMVQQYRSTSQFSLCTQHSSHATSLQIDLASKKCLGRTQRHTKINHQSPDTCSIQWKCSPPAFSEENIQRVIPADEQNNFPLQLSTTDDDTRKPRDNDRISKPSHAS